MTSGNEHLVVRQHDRHECQVAVEVAVSSEHARKVVLSRTVGDGAGTIQVTMVDISSGGLGLSSNVFLPKGCHLDVRLIRADDQAGGSKSARTIFETRVRIQRTAMVDKSPTYYIGTAFISDDPVEESQRRALMEQIRNGALSAGEAGAHV
ncbi:MAG: PilZ domain-containing protein [Phycisphaeraceae bacterium]|nr:PilZ domain-containing protein [Phycisphaeraceae bacterium]